jgi:AraC-like DNA-binding protein
MSCGPDTFARFVGMVEAHLDDSSVSGEELAALLHLSRSQLDRVVSAVAGESPGTFRRRILLERAAYRLMVAGSSVLDIAVEAGYSSNEAFTRAFKRAYGVAPSSWRLTPGQVQVNTPNGVHFHPPGGLRLPPRTGVPPMNLPVVMTEHHIWLIGELIEGASTLSSAVIDAPITISVQGIDESPTVRSLLSRLVGQLDMWNCAVANRPYDFGVEVNESLESMRARLASCGPVFLAQVQDACDRGTLDETFVDTQGERPVWFTCGGMIAHVLTYAAHRRTLVVGALYDAGITELEDDPLAWDPVHADGPTLR